MNLSQRAKYFVNDIFGGETGAQKFIQTKEETARAKMSLVADALLQQKISDRNEKIARE